jgi:hypothetical protein
VWRCSDVLDEDAEPLEVLPEARLGPALLAALRVMYAAEAEFDAWSSMQDAVRDLLAAPGGASAVDGAPTAVGAASEAVGHGRRAPNGGAAGEAHPGAGGMEAGAREEAEEETRLLGPLPVAEAFGVVGGAACEALKEALEQRLSEYARPGVEEDLRELAERRARAALGVAGAARKAALTLVVAEKRVLMEALAAVKVVLSGGIGPPAGSAAARPKRRRRCS